MIEQVTELVPPWALAAAMASLGGTAAGTAAVMHRRSRTRELEAQQRADEGQEPERRRRKLSAGTLAAAVAFMVCTSVSLNTSYRFTFDGLGMTGAAERVLSCAAFEALIAMCVLGARERMASKDHTPGWYGTAVWIFAALSSVPAWHEGGGLTAGTVVRIIVGSFGSALSAHAALGLELKHRTGGQSQSPGALIVRELRERLMARLGLIQRGRDAEQIARDRYMDRAVDLADEYDRLTGGERSRRRGRKVCRHLARAMDRAGCAEPERRAIFDRRLAMRRDVAGLPDVDLPLTWTAQPTPEEQAATAQIESQIQHMEDLAAQIEDRMARPGAISAQQWPEGRNEDGTRTAAHDDSGTHRITLRVPVPNEDKEGQDEEGLEAPDLRRYGTKRAMLKALFDRHGVRRGDPRSHNQIATELLEQMERQGIKYDRGAACRAIGDWRNPQVKLNTTEVAEVAQVAQVAQVEEVAQADLFDRELSRI